jgi:hypothetical protein
MDVDVDDSPRPLQTPLGAYRYFGTFYLAGRVGVTVSWRFTFFHTGSPHKNVYQLRLVLNHNNSYSYRENRSPFTTDVGLALP